MYALYMTLFFTKTTFLHTRFSFLQFFIGTTLKSIFHNAYQKQRTLLKWKIEGKFFKFYWQLLTIYLRKSSQTHVTIFFVIPVKEKLLKLKGNQCFGNKKLCKS